MSKMSTEFEIYFFPVSKQKLFFCTNIFFCYIGDKMFCMVSLFMKRNTYVVEGGNEGERGVTPTSILIFEDLMI